MTEKNQYTQHWDQARKRAVQAGLRIIEHGWEQHVIIDEDQGIVYRYPRHAAAAAKLNDEVQVLQTIHKRSWSTQLPVMREHNELFTAYNYIAGEVLSKDWLDRLSSDDCKNLGTQLGAFLAELHTLNHNIIDQKKTRHSTTLLEYYEERIQGAVGTPMHSAAADALSHLTISAAPSVVVHGDLHGLNIVIDPETRSLSGVIDLSEMEVGDPHQDFRKLFMTDHRLVEPAIAAYGSPLSANRVRLWAYVNEWANICYFSSEPTNPTYRRALEHLQEWGQI